MKQSVDGTTKRGTLTGLSLAALGIVFGDIGTSPLYAIRECFHGEYALAVTRDHVLGILSLMFWSLMIIVSIKYVAYMLLADNRGEGGVLALTALVKSLTSSPTRRRLILIGLGVFAACLLYGDGMITPAISVLSAVEGLRVIQPELQQYVIPLTLLILAALFMLQRRGTAKVGGLFGPVILVWFLVLATLGLRQIILNPDVLAAVLPTYAIRFVMESGFHGFTVLGAVFLVVTGAEALYADLGHFGRKPIRRVWFFFVLPALLLNYFGQGALLMLRPAEAHHPFYATVPGWAVVPMVFLATAATIIASQAVITGVFSLTRQAIQMGYLPRLRIVHTSASHFGQIYIPAANWLVMIATLVLVVGFQSSSKLAAAYGVAVTSTMLISTMLFFVVARKIWKWSLLPAGLLAALFFVVDFSFLSANLSKILHGAWFPLAIGGAMMIVMMTWRRGRKILGKELSGMTMPFAKLRHRMSEERLTRVRGHAVFLTGSPKMVPVSLTHNIEHNRVVHANVVLLNFSFIEVPRVPNEAKLQIEDLGSGFHEITASYGFMESPSVAHALELAKGQGLDVPLEEASFFLGREKLVIGDDRQMSQWRTSLFAFLSKNAYDASAYYGIPPNRVMEVGIRLTM